MINIRLKPFRTFATGTLLTILVGCSNSNQEWTDSCSQSAPVSTHPQAENARIALLEALQKDRGAGISAAVTIDGELVWRDAVGVAKSDLPLSTGAKMRIGSVSKPFTAVLIARLAEKGLIEFDAPIRQYLPYLPDHFDKVTIRQLGNHTSGMRQYNFASLSDSNNLDYHRSLIEAFQPHLDEPLVFEPGSELGYSSLGYNLLGVLVEDLFGVRYRDALSAEITEPLGLGETVTDDSETSIPCRSKSYSVLFAKLRLTTLPRDNSDTFASGGLLSSATDIVHFADQVFQTDWLDANTKRAMQSRGVLADGSRIDRSFGWEVVEAENGTDAWLGHGGTINGAYASVRHYPKHRMTVAMIANYDLQLTRQRAAFFRSARKTLPALFSGANASNFED